MIDRISKAIILIGFVGVVWVTNVEPMVPVVWATATRQPAGHEPSLFHVSAKGDHQAHGGGR